MSSLGLYFGSKFIQLVETKGKKIQKSIHILRTAVSVGELQEKFSEEDKIATLLQDAMIKSGIEAEEVSLCLPGKDLIIRSFEMPVLSRAEMAAAVNFEVRKYIPFKVEDLVTDYQVFFDKASRTNLVLFMGIKEERLNSYKNILQKLDLRISSIEYSAFSILRLFKLANLGNKGVRSIFTVDLLGEEENNFVVLDNSFPVFSRDIVLTGASTELKEIKEESKDYILEKLKAEIRVSLDYYRRKFPEKSNQNIYILSNQSDRAKLETIVREIEVPVSFVDLAKYIDYSTGNYLSLLKGYSVSLGKTVNTKLLINLALAAEKKEEPEKITLREIVSFFKELSLDRRVVVLCLFAILAIYAFGIYRALPLKRELKKTIEANVQLSSDKQSTSYEELVALETKSKEKLSALEGLVKGQIYLTEILNVIPRAISEGAWLTNIDYHQFGDGRAEMFLDGMIYLEQSDMEFSEVSKFVSFLKGSPEFKKYFNKVSISSLDSRESNNKKMTTHFNIISQNY